MWLTVILAALVCYGINFEQISEGNICIQRTTRNPDASEFGAFCRNLAYDYAVIHFHLFPVLIVHSNKTIRLFQKSIIWTVRVIFALAVLPLLYLIEPFKKIRFHIMFTRRIGHLAGNTDLILRRLQLGHLDPKALYILAGVEPVNRQLFEMLKRVLHVYESRWLTRILFYIRPILRKTRFYEPAKWIDPGYVEFNDAGGVVELHD